MRTVDVETRPDPTRADVPFHPVAVDCGGCCNSRGSGCRCVVVA